MPSHPTPTPLRRNALACAAIAALMTQGANAATVEWIGGSGNWFDFTHWSGGFMPRAGFNAALGHGSAVTPSVTVDFQDVQYTPGAGIGQLLIDSTGILGTFTLLQSKSDSVMIADSEIVGNTISGNVYEHNAGSNTTNLLTLGNAAGGFGNYNLSGTGVLNAQTLTVGQGGAGGFDQSGSSAVFTKFISVGIGTGFPSSYTLRGGSITVADGGQVNVQPARGSFSHSGGTLAFTGNSGLVIGLTAASTSAAYTLSGSGSITGASYENIGVNVTGAGASFTQLAGSNVLAAGGVLTVGFNSSGGYSLFGGSVGAQTITVGAYAGSVGGFAQTGGTVGAGELDLGWAAGSNGTYIIDNRPVIGASVLSAPVIKVGVAGAGNFYQSNGSVSATVLTLAEAAGATGTYSMSGGALTLGSATQAGTLYVGLSGSGVFAQTAGDVTVRGAGGAEGSVQITRDPFATGTYFLKGGRLSADRVLVGTLGIGSFVQGAGTLNVSGSGLFVGYSGAGSFDLSTSAGSSTLTTTTETVGLFGDGRFSQRGTPTHVVTVALRVGAANGTTGIFGMDGGTLDAAALQVGLNGGTGSVVQRAGDVTVRAGGLQLGSAGSSGSYVLAGGALVTGNAADSFVLNPSGTFSQQGGIFVGTLSNSGSFNYTGGTFAGRLDNTFSGLVNITGSLVAGGGVLNRGTITLAVGSTLGSGAASSLINDVTLQLAGGAVGGAGAIVNNGSLGGYGSIGGSGGFTNNGVWTVGLGNVALSNSGSNANVGIIDLGSGRQLQLAGAALANSGTLALNAGLVTGSGTLTNTTAGNIGGVGTIATPLVNRGVIVPGAGAISVPGGFTNAGVVNLTGPLTGVAGGAIGNTGTIQGAGNVGAAVGNSGSIEAIGGTLVVTGAITNTSSGRLAAGAGSKLLAQGGVSDNAGLIVLTGGAFDSGAGTLTNNGQITGFGSLSSGALVNAGAMSFTGGNTTVNGALTNSAGRTVLLAYNPTTFTGAVTNNGTLHTLATTVVFAGGLVNNGVLATDPSTLRFTTLAVGNSGVVNASAGNRFVVSGSFVNLSTQAVAWDTRAASLVFDGTAPESLVLAGLDLGTNRAGYTDNFAWGRVEIAAGTTLAVNSASGHNALYAGAFVLDAGLAQLSSIHSDANLYYDPTLADNAYLGAATYALSGGGFLAAAVPEPEPWILLLGGLIPIVRRLRDPRYRPEC